MGLLQRNHQLPLIQSTTTAVRSNVLPIIALIFISGLIVKSVHKYVTQKTLSNIDQEQIIIDIIAPLIVIILLALYYYSKEIGNMLSRRVQTTVQQYDNELKEIIINADNKLIKDTKSQTSIPDELICTIPLYSFYRSPHSFFTQTTKNSDISTLETVQKNGEDSNYLNTRISAMQKKIV